MKHGGKGRWGLRCTHCAEALLKKDDSVGELYL